MRVFHCKFKRVETGSVLSVDVPENALALAQALLGDDNFFMTEYQYYGDQASEDPFSHRDESEGDDVCP